MQKHEEGEPATYISRGKGRRKVEVFQGSPSFKTQKERMTDRHLILNASIVTRKVIMHETVLRKERGHAITLEATTITKEEKTIKEIIVTGDMKEEEETPQAIVKKIILLKIGQGLPGMKVML